MGKSYESVQWVAVYPVIREVDFINTQETGHAGWASAKHYPLQSSCILWKVENSLRSTNHLSTYGTKRLFLSQMHTDMPPSDRGNNSSHFPAKKG